jgi:hypothetical protein
MTSNREYFDPDIPCRILPTRTCPESYGESCGDRPCARYESEAEEPWIKESKQSNEEYDKSD